VYNIGDNNLKFSIKTPSLPESLPPTLHLNPLHRCVTKFPYFDQTADRSSDEHAHQTNDQQFGRNKETWLFLINTY